MKITVVTIGHRLPDWANEACEDYLKRFPPDWKVEVKALKAEPREGKPVAAIMAAEAARMEAAMDKGVRRVILDERGTRLTSVQLAERTEAWLHDGRDVVLVIGGADGIDPQLKQTADEAIRLSDMTLPHALARVLLLEQLYRAWSLRNNHPYHRAGSTVAVCFGHPRLGWPHEPAAFLLIEPLVVPGLAKPAPPPVAGPAGRTPRAAAARPGRGRRIPRSRGAGRGP